MTEITTETVSKNSRDASAARCPECNALVGHWKPCSKASDELQERWRVEDVCVGCRVLNPEATDAAS